MNPESEAANQAVSQVIRIVGDGLDIALRLTGAAARETAILLYTAMKSQGEKQTRPSEANQDAANRYRENFRCAGEQNEGVCAGGQALRHLLLRPAQV